MAHREQPLGKPNPATGWMTSVENNIMERGVGQWWSVNGAIIDVEGEGSDLTLKALNAAFGRAAIREVDPVGQKFDPHVHQAMSVVDSDLPPNTVVTVYQKGYLLNDRVLRPALVTVSKSQEDG